jgi:hypothetical protein
MIAAKMPDVRSQIGLEKRARHSAGRFCVLVTSSDVARDVFEIVFQNTEAIWRDCDWPRFVGFTSKHPDIYGFKSLAECICKPRSCCSYENRPTGCSLSTNK